MRILHKIEDMDQTQSPIILTLGNFDGIHRGHLSVLNRSRYLADHFNGRTCAITFSNHPSHILRPHFPTPLICNLEHKLKLLEPFIDALILLPFTQELATQSAEAFVKKLRTHIPFSHLILGHDATLGKDRQGNQATMQNLAQKCNFQIEYMPEYRFEETVVSSSRIRHYLQQGHLNEVKRLLGRPYSIYASILPGMGKGKQIGYPTANMNVPDLCLPPYGVYAVTVNYQGQDFQGVANLGIAPTIRKNSLPILEVHLFSFIKELYGQTIEVIFHHFIRSEKKFDCVETLKEQIQRDIDKARALMENKST